MKDAAPVAEQNGGNLRDLITNWQTASAPRFSFMVSSPAEYSSYVEEGTSPHDIFGNPYLAWEGGNGIVIINASKTPVHHPGTRAEPFFNPAVESWADKLQERFN